MAVEKEFDAIAAAPTARLFTPPAALAFIPRAITPEPADVVADDATPNCNLVVPFSQHDVHGVHICKLSLSLFSMPSI
jgi:hypothetical protein